METKNGQILGSNGGLFTVLTEQGERIGCKAGGRFRHAGRRVLVGDLVTVSEGEDGCMITAVAERKNALIRPPMANLSRLYIVLSGAAPKTLPLNADKLIAICEHERIEPVIVVTKEDLDGEECDSLAALYRDAGFSAFVTASHTGAGVDALRREILFTPGLSAFAGASGAGKSSLLNALFPALGLEVGDLSRKIERGKNTTRAVTVYPLRELDPTADPAAFLADTPGFTMLDFVEFDFFSLADLPDTFREFAPYLGKCLYTDCRHTGDAGCAVCEAVWEGKIARSRYESYCALYNDLKDKHDWEKK